MPSSGLQTMRCRARAGKRAMSRHVARDKRGRAALREPGGVHLLVHVPQALRAVHDQHALRLRRARGCRSCRCIPCRRGVLAHEDARRSHPSGATCGSPSVNQACRSSRHASDGRTRPRPCRHAATGRAAPCRELKAARLRGEQHRQRGVLRGLDVLDRVHHDADAAGTGGNSQRSPDGAGDYARCVANRSASPDSAGHVQRATASAKRDARGMAAL